MKFLITLLLLLIFNSSQAQTGKAKADTISGAGTVAVINTLKKFVFDSSVAKVELKKPLPKIIQDRTFNAVENRKSVKYRIVVYSNYVAEIYKNGIKQK